MQLKLIRHLWGVTLPWDQAFEKARAEGFVGIEAPLSAEADAGRFRDLLARHGFEYIAMAFTGGANVAAHLDSFRTQLERARVLGAMQVTCHSGSDAMGRADADAFYREAVRIERDLGVTVGHETHRGRVFFNPWVTRDILASNDAIRLCCDFSHWVCVAERLLGDCDDIIATCVERCVHTHARVGYEEGPQVPDPSAPEYARCVAAHEGWWDMIWRVQQARGAASTTITPEFGPPGYMHTLPHTNQPVADLWQVCKWMADRVKARFEGGLWEKAE